MDTLHAAAGGAKPRVVRGRVVDAVLGMLGNVGAYDPLTNTVALGGLDTDAEHTLIHEMGHRKQAHDTPLKSLPFRDKRYGADPKEGYAEAFVNAINLLRSGDTTNVRERLGQLEARSPGTGTLTRDLLGKPVFADSPFRKVIR